MHGGNTGVRCGCSTQTPRRRLHGPGHGQRPQEVTTMAKGTDARLRRIERRLAGLEDCLGSAMNVYGNTKNDAEGPVTLGVWLSDLEGLIQNRRLGGEVA